MSAERIKAGLVLFYLSRGHTQEEASDYAERHLKGDNSFVANEVSTAIPQEAEPKP